MEFYSLASDPFFTDLSKIYVAVRRLRCSGNFREGTGSTARSGARLRRRERPAPQRCAAPAAAIDLIWPRGVILGGAARPALCGTAAGNFPPVVTVSGFLKGRRCLLHARPQFTVLLCLRVSHVATYMVRETLHIFLKREFRMYGVLNEVNL